MSIRNVIDEVLGFWRELMFPKDLVEREIKLPIDPKNIVVVTGVRRSGKTYLMFQTIKDLVDSGVDENRIFYINFEDERILPRTEFLTEILPTIRERYTSSEEIYLFLDEIHRIPNWDLWVNRIHAKGYKIYISGSTYALKPDRIPRALRGRTLTFEIYPLSFREFLSFKNQNKVVRLEEFRSEEKKAVLIGYLNEYLEYGGYPEVVKTEVENEKILLLHDYFRAIMYRDIIEGGRIDDEYLLEIFLKQMASTIVFSSTKIFNTLRSMGIKTSKATILKYKREIEKSYLINQAPIFSKKIKDQNQYPKKLYFIDHGLRRSISQVFKESRSLTLENMIYTELLRRKNINESINYWKSQRGYEVDFVVVDDFEPKKLYQVSYSVEEDKTKKREERALIEAMKELQINQATIITWNYGNLKKINGKMIRYTPAWKFLLKNKI